MKEYRVDVATIIDHGNGIAEWIGDEDAEVTAEHIQRSSRILLACQPPVSFLLVNRKNRYVYAFSAIWEIRGLKFLSAVAVVEYGRVSTIRHTILPKFFGPRYFDEREAALNWLVEQKDAS